ncbi:hypothetical protein PUN28_005043 [Cardiocondyla obscurior]|uniref:Uncharacterized protein n=1 Tax=Cardiocondyla obscurior TaxID=286306 RepID=A0AAW2GIE9_9HYME
MKLLQAILKPNRVLRKIRGIYLVILNIPNACMARVKQNDSVDMIIGIKMLQNENCYIRQQVERRIEITK